MLDDSVPADTDVHVVRDNDGAHKSPVAKRWFARHPRFHPHVTPTSASWINQVERRFAEIARQQTAVALIAAPVN